MRRQKAESLGQAIQKWIDSNSFRPQLRDARVCGEWPQIAGERLAQATTSIRIRDKVLYVKLSSGLAQHELQMLRPKLIERINSEYGEGNVLVADIRIER